MTELEYYKELARLWEVSSFDFRARTQSSFDDGATHHAAVDWASRKDELTKPTGNPLDLGVKEQLIGGGEWKPKGEYTEREFYNETLGKPFVEPGDVIPGPTMVSDDFPYPENEGSTHYDGCFRQRKHHNCAVRRIDDLNAEGIMARRVNRALRMQLKDIWLDNKPHAELQRLRTAFWALSYAPWTEGAPGLEAYVKDLITSGHTQLDPKHTEELVLHLHGESDEHSVSTTVARGLASDKEG